MKLNIKSFGAVGDGVANDTAAIQAAINFIQYNADAYCLELDPGLYRCIAPLLITKPLHIKGDGAAWGGTSGTIIPADFRGAWLYFDHSGVGVNINSTVYNSDIQFTGFGTVRNQPSPAVNWSPSPHDYDFKSSATSDIYFSHIFLLNPTKGIQMNLSGYGRLFVDHLKGQPFQIGINVDLAYDVCYFNTVHFWPFWADNALVHNYTMANLDGFRLGRCDNPHMSSIFTIFARAGIAIYQNEYGTTSKIHAVNLDFDRGLYGLWIQSSVTTGATGQLVNFACQGETDLAGSKGIFIQGSNSEFDITNFSSVLANMNSIRIEGTGNTLDLSGKTKCTNYDKCNGGYPAIKALTGNTVSINGTPTITDGNKYGVGGLIYAALPMAQVNI